MRFIEGLQNLPESLGKKKSELRVPTKIQQRMMLGGLAGVDVGMGIFVASAMADPVVAWGIFVGQLIAAPSAIVLIKGIDGYFTGNDSF